MMPTKIVIEMNFSEKSKSWFVTSPQIKGLLVCARTPLDALEESATAIRELLLATEWERTEGRPAKPVFTGTAA